jgi:hypothetical protein
LQKDEMLRDGCEWNSRISWPSGFTIEMECRIEPPHWRKLRCKYEVEDYNGEPQSIDETFYLQRFPQPFGGYRWYFVCPSDNRRCTVLYQPPGATRFRSRWGFRRRLQYQSQRLAPQSRHQHAAEQIAKRIAKKGPLDWQEKYGDWQFPPKPPWMRWKTYNGFDQRAQAHEQVADAIMSFYFLVSRLTT